jgi:hypothetical protein
MLMWRRDDDGFVRLTLLGEFWASERRQEVER